MKHPIKLAALAASVLVLQLAGCATGHVDPSDRDTTGQYDGVWIGEVAEPRSSTAILPGNWSMSCGWEPYQIYLVVDDGRVQLGKLEGKTPVSTKGTFRIDVNSGDAGMRSGVMSGNGQFVQIFSGNLAGERPTGKYAQYITSLGTAGCSSTIRFRRDSDTVS